MTDMCLRSLVKPTLLLSALLSGASAQSEPIPARLDLAALDRFMTQTMKEYDVPGVGLAIVQRGRIVYTHGYGVRDVGSRRPVDEDTQFAIGSVTKSFTALETV